MFDELVIEKYEESLHQWLKERALNWEESYEKQKVL